MKEQTAWIVVRSIFSLILLVFIGIIFFGKCDDPITNATLSCKWTGGIQDIVGLIIFLASLIWFSGLADVVSGKLNAGSVYDKVENKKGMGLAGIIGGVGVIIGVGLIYL